MRNKRNRRNRCRRVAAVLLIVALGCLMGLLSGCVSEDKQETALQQTESKQQAASGIDRSKAKAIALEKVPGASESDLVELEVEEDDGRLEYEGEIVYGGYQYEFEIDGETGNILKWEIDD